MLRGEEPPSDSVIVHREVLAQPPQGLPSYGMRLRAFAEDYLKSQRARSLPNELERVVDVLAAWELLKATTSAADPWQGG